MLVLSVCALVLALATPAAAASKKTTTAQKQAKAEKAKLAQVTQQVQTQQQRSVSARQAVQAANVTLRSARAQEAAVEKHLAAVRSSIKGYAVDAYVNGGIGQASPLPGVGGANELARAEHLRDAIVGSESDVLEALATARADLDAKRLAAENAARVATGRQRAVNDALASLKRSQAAQFRLVGAAEARYQSLRDAEGFRGNVALATVHGITVAASIAPRLNSMLNAADADGYHFGGTGYRSSAGQIATRKRNCGSSSYDVYDKPSGSCHPPTAKPGQSMHERGLAVDFTYNGSIINSHGNAGFRWLAGHASSYGFYNLPSEAWHWSVNGN